MRLSEGTGGRAIVQTEGACNRFLCTEEADDLNAKLRITLRFGFWIFIQPGSNLRTYSTHTNIQSFSIKPLLYSFI